jgi:hypothetical protein
MDVRQFRWQHWVNVRMIKFLKIKKYWSQPIMDGGNSQEGL